VDHRVNLYPENIPLQLKAVPQWICYRRVPNKKDPTKFDKIPIDSKINKKASVSDPQTWAGFEKALTRYQKDSTISGVGIVLTEDLGIVGIDLDKCLTEDGSFQWGAEDVSKINSYTEKSPSETGIRIFAYGKLPPNGRKQGNVEIYISGRFLTVTGNIIGGNRTLEYRHDEIWAFHGRIFTGASFQYSSHKKTQTKGEKELEQQETSVDEKKITQIILNSKQKKLFQQLMSGDWGAFVSPGGRKYPSQSEADLALLAILAFYTGKNPALMRTIFKKSMLYRGKCEQARGMDGSTYLDKSLDKAIAGCRNIYNPNKRQVKTGDLISHIEDLNKQYAVSMLASRCVIINETNEEVEFLRVNDFKLFHQNKKIMIKDANGNEKICAVVDLWLKSEKRRQYPRIEFKPGINNAPNYNLWRGFSVIAKRGDWSLMQDHIEKQICRGHEKSYRYIYAWIARIYQHPGGERPGVALVLRGKQGTGKGIFARYCGMPLEKHFVQVFSPHQFAGKFNAHLKMCVLLFADEAFMTRNQEGTGILRGMITEPFILCEPKGIDAFRIENHINVIAAGNASYIIPAGEAERRFCVLDVSDSHLQDSEYFRKLCFQMDNGGVEAMFNDLLNLDISGVNLRDFPRSSALFDQQLRCMSPVQQWWLECLKSGTHCHDLLGKASESDWHVLIPVDEVFAEFTLFMEGINIKNTLAPTLFGRELRQICPALKRSRIKSGDDRAYYYHFPSLDECRKLFSLFIKFEIPWDDF